MTMGDKYYYQEGAIHHDNKQVMNISVSGKVDIGALIKGFFTKDAEDMEEVQEVLFDETAGKTELPEVFSTAEAKALHTKLQQAGMVDANWQPIKLSNAEKGTLAEYIAEKLGIKSKWKLFGTLWQVDAETLRTAKARGLEQDKTWEFRHKLNGL